MVRQWIMLDIDFVQLAPSTAPGVEEFPVMLVTARRLNSPQREEFVSTWSQADDVLYKPFGITRLLDRVNELCPCPAGVA